MSFDDFDPTSDKYGETDHLRLLMDFYAHLDGRSVRPFPVHIDLWKEGEPRGLIIDIKSTGDADITWATRNKHLRRWGIISLKGERRYKSALKALRHIPIERLKEKIDEITRNFPL